MTPDAPRSRPLSPRQDGRTDGTFTLLDDAHPGVRDPRSVRPGDWHPFINALIIATVAMLTVVAIAAAWTATPIGEVRSWQQWTSETGEWSLEYPSGWRVHEFPAGDGQTHLMITRSEWVRIHFIAGPELRQAVEVYTPERSAYAALEAVHGQTAGIWAAVLGAMQLRESEVRRTVIGGRRATWSQFRYPGGAFEGDELMTGYRTTIAGRKTGAIVSAVAPTRYWTRFRPIATHVLRSVGPAEDAG